MRGGVVRNVDESHGAELADSTDLNTSHSQF